VKILMNSWGVGGLEWIIQLSPSKECLELWVTWHKITGLNQYLCCLSFNFVLWCFKFVCWIHVFNTLRSNQNICRCRHYIPCMRSPRISKNLLIPKGIWKNWHVEVSKLASRVIPTISWKLCFRSQKQAAEP
jgi:hypothetical protein